ncbi:CRISPR-associated protein Csx19 [Nodularia sp. LEGE 04288]|uniref:type III-D CRISPR-associated protein Csx19 n=1 Tax=Nodularia sp. LEGE 04288 TaxID=1828639 RepID=UPI001D117968|nr:CRISPR-associated protein Csx19 [Nodularia sp. LEGE 04288]MCC2693898.1 TIGR03984 family CRISPR-associated protein [Nodularia sp. LEGE 04288]
MNKPICKTLAISTNSDINEWLEKQAEEYQLKFLLAHAEDGVIWGKFKDGKLLTADSAFKFLPKLRLFTLQQCRAFGETSEVMLWQTDEGFKARLIQDEKNTEFIPENHILSGTQADKICVNFTLVSDGSQGLRHAVPLTNIEFDDNQKLYRPLRLRVHHYVDYNYSGVARIDLSRLVNLTTFKVIK